MKTDKAAILIKKAALEFDKISNAVLDEYDLTVAQYKVMKYLYEEDKARIVDMERYYSMSHPTTIGIVQNLEKKRLVEYKENPDNSHSRFIVPTSKALKLKKEINGIGDELEDELTRSLSKKERKQLIDLLQKMMGIKEE